MITISRATLKRLRKIKQSPIIWEGARCSVPVPPRPHMFANVIPITAKNRDAPEYVLWADATSGTIRSMCMVEPNSGSEVLVRSLLQAIERPQSNCPPLRPQKIVVNDRESQFYLRGILHELDITVEFAETLPLIEEILYTLGEQSENIPDPIPLHLAPNLYRQANALWDLAPWEYLNDYHVIKIKIDRWDIDSFYLTVIGRMFLQKGLIFYHNLESIQKFRLCALQEMEDSSIANAFLSQDCIFMMFDPDYETSEEIKHLIHSFGWRTKTHYPSLGVFHPLEGERTFLQEEEVLALTVALESLVQFFTQHKKSFRIGVFPELQASYIPTTVPEPSPVEITTLVEESRGIISLTGEYDEESFIKRYIIPKNSLLQLTFVDPESLEGLRSVAQYRVLKEKKTKTKEGPRPIILIQNSKPLITQLIKDFAEEGNLEGISFVPTEETGELGLFITGNGNFHLFEELYQQDDRSSIFKHWKQECQESKSCVVILAMGIRGKTRGNPKPNHILAYYEIDYISQEKLDSKIFANLDFD